MLRRLLSPLTESTYALLRFMAGALFSCHGFQKIFGFLAVGDHGQVPTGSFVWCGGMVELVCGVAIALGLFTRLAAFLASGEMAVAYFHAHYKPPDSAAFFPIVNQGELAVLYCFVFLFIACRGGGRWSIDGAGPRVGHTTVVSAPSPSREAVRTG